MAARKGEINMTDLTLKRDHDGLKSFSLFFFSNPDVADLWGMCSDSIQNLVGSRLGFWVRRWSSMESSSGCGEGYWAIVRGVWKL